MRTPPSQADYKSLKGKLKRQNSQQKRVKCQAYPRFLVMSRPRRPVRGDGKRLCNGSAQRDLCPSERETPRRARRFAGNRRGALRRVDRETPLLIEFPCCPSSAENPAEKREGRGGFPCVDPRHDAPLVMHVMHFCRGPSRGTRWKSKSFSLIFELSARGFFVTPRPSSPSPRRGKFVSPWIVSSRCRCLPGTVSASCPSLRTPVLCVKYGCPARAFPDLREPEDLRKTAAPRLRPHAAILRWIERFGTATTH